MQMIALSIERMYLTGAQWEYNIGETVQWNSAADIES